MTTLILRLPAVLDRIGLSRSTVYDMMARGTFPRPVRLSERAVGWRETDIEGWLAARSETVPGASFRRGRRPRRRS